MVVLMIAKVVTGGCFNLGVNVAQNEDGVKDNPKQKGDETIPVLSPDGTQASLGIIVVAQAGKVKEEPTKEEIDALIKKLGDKDEYVQQSAAEALGKIGKSAVPALIWALKDENWRVRKSAAYALGEIGDKSAVSALIEALKDKDENVRRYAAEALEKIDLPVLHVFPQVLKDEAGDVRKYAIEALKKLEPDKSKALIELLKDKNPRVRESAAKALGEIGDQQALEPLAKLMGQGLFESQDPDKEVVKAAHESYLKILRGARGK